METTVKNAISRALQKMLEVNEKGVNEFDRMERGLLTENARLAYGMSMDDAKRETRLVRHDRAIAEAAGGGIPAPLIVIFRSVVVVQEIVTFINREIENAASAGADEAALEALRAELQTALSDKNGLQVQLDSANETISAITSDKAALQAQVTELTAARDALQAEPDGADTATLQARVTALEAAIAQAKEAATLEAALEALDAAL